MRPFQPKLSFWVEVFLFRGSTSKPEVDLLFDHEESSIGWLTLASFCSLKRVVTETTKIFVVYFRLRRSILFFAWG